MRLCFVTLYIPSRIEDRLPGLCGLRGTMQPYFPQGRYKDLRDSALPMLPSLCWAQGLRLQLQPPHSRVCVAAPLCPPHTLVCSVRMTSGGGCARARVSVGPVRMRTLFAVLSDCGGGCLQGAPSLSLPPLIRLVLPVLGLRSAHPQPSVLAALLGAFVPLQGFITFKCWETHGRGAGVHHRLLLITILEGTKKLWVIGKLFSTRKDDSTCGTILHVALAAPL